MNGRLSVTEKLVLAAYALEERGRVPFSAEDIVVEAWKQFPDTFGLSGYRDRAGRFLYPDSNRVYAEIMGSKPVRKHGLLVKVGNKMYQLTEAGRQQARILGDPSSKEPQRKAGLARDIQQELERLFGTKAMEKFRNGRAADLTFHDACSFWSVSPRSSAIEFNGRIANLYAILDAARGAIASDPAVSFEHRGEGYSTQDLDNLFALNKELQNRFHLEVEVIKKRTDERR